MSIPGPANAVLSGYCWRACPEYEDVKVTFVGVAVSDGGKVPLYSCRSCVGLMRVRILRGNPNRLCWLWCGRTVVEPLQIGVLEIDPLRTDLFACGDCARLVLRVIRSAQAARDKGGYGADGTRLLPPSSRSCRVA